jgi:hypothetical protein
MAPSFLSTVLDIGERSASRPQGDTLWKQFYMRLCGFQGRSRYYGEEKNLLPLPGIES